MPQPIGLFDSGIGGLTVLKTLLEEFASEDFLYLGDTARLPYGTKSPATIERYVLQNIRYLEQQNVKAIVVACNSASTVLLGGRLQHLFKVPVYNVIEPGARAALQASTNKKIGVIGTRATVQGEAYVSALHALDSEAQVWQQACPLLVPLVEEGWTDDPVTNLIVYRYLGPLAQTAIDTLIMGCTHYPALSDSFRRVLGSHVTLVDSAQAIAQILAADFQDSKLEANPLHHQRQVRITATDVSTSFEQIAHQMLSPHRFKQLELVELY